ncbi:MAG: PAS domain S-box protein [Alphaproteobacteria bacterium]|nr:PAS domain S-box protein [Alphaproteobacteria bacterium]MBU0805414.1 PAS domain S-box protein [Alphaproteobacteria bacterium]MBU0873360.1 PAS domain S-box protein [Alphaproteobacteria bacterium]MBU1401412.1 PAS domain S-box protein [Alphaproteobacteria bacterium]MBU1592171.1 PAS domain S-box protein [Alphaproteobacteria bacterium]
MKRASNVKHWAGTVCASLLAGAVFAIDLQEGLDAAVAVLYALVIVLGARWSGRRSVWFWTGLCAVLAVASYLWVHGERPDLSSTLRLVFALVAIGISAALSWSRQLLLEVQKELRETEQAQRIIVDSVPQVLWGTLPDGTCDFLNARYTEMTGLDVGEAIREQSWTEAIHPDDREEMARLFSVARETGDEFRASARVRRRDGSYRWVTSVGRPIRSPQTGQISRWFGGLFDVDDEFRAQEKIHELNETLERLVAERTAELDETRWRFRSLYDSPNIFVAEQNWSEAGIVLQKLKADGVTDLRGHLLKHHDLLQACIDGVRTVDVNDAIWRKLGFDSKLDLVAKAPREGVVDPVAALLPQLEALYEGRDYVTGTTTLIRADGGRMPVIFAVNLLADGTAYATLFDITEREKAHELMVAAQQELARASRIATVGALSISIAHELNQPITSMSVDIDMAGRILAKEAPMSDATARIVERLKRNVHRLASIVQRTRDQIANRRRAFECVDIAALAEETRLTLEREIIARRAVVKVRVKEMLPSVSADRVALQQVLVNLIVNALDAVTAAPEDRRTVEVKLDRDNEGSVQVTVTDTGPGIRDEDIPRIFEPFFTTKKGGIGMGLQICRTTVEELGGELRAFNQLKGGAAFQFSLPPAVTEGAETPSSDTDAVGDLAAQLLDEVPERPEA